MRSEFIIKLAPSERKMLEEKCKQTKLLLVEIGDKITDPKEKNIFWEKVRNFNDIANVFKE